MKSIQIMFVSIFSLSLLLGSWASPRSPGCDLCIQIVTAIDDFITDASTEQDIIDFVEGVGFQLEKQILILSIEALLQPWLAP